MLHSFAHFAWQFVTRFGEGLFLLPAAVGLALWVAAQVNGVRIAGWWLIAVGLAASVTAVSKIAFMGWGIGSATWNFTGVSGHTMFSTAIYPLLFGLMLSAVSPLWRRWGIAIGYLLAIVIGVSRVRIDAHSWSEVLVGFAVGGLASGLVLAFVRVPKISAPRWLAGALALWLLAVPFGMPRPPTHDWVTKVALVLSGRPAPYTRNDLHRDAGTSMSPRAMLMDSVKQFASFR